MSYSTMSVDADTSSPVEDVFVDYFGFHEETLYYLPLPSGGDSPYYLKLVKMNQGDKARFQKATSRDLRVQRSTGDALMKMDPGAETWALLDASVKGWNLKRRNPKNESMIEPAPFDTSNFKRFVEAADPELIQGVEKAIRKLNPWLMDEMSVEEIDKEIASLQELREIAVKREEGKLASAA